MMGNKLPERHEIATIKMSQMDPTPDSLALKTSQQITRIALVHPILHNSTNLAYYVLILLYAIY